MFNACLKRASVARAVLLQLVYHLMNFGRGGLLFGAVLPLVSLQLHAQQADASGWQLALNPQSTHTTRRDETASPFRFSGRGVGATLDAVRVTPGWLTGGSVAAYSATLATSATQSHEQFASAEFSLHAMRTVAGGSAAGEGEHGSFRVHAGLEFRTSVDATNYNFSLSNVPNATYRFVTVSAGPMLHVSKLLSWGEMSVQLRAPVASYVDHPYSEVKSAYSDVHFAFASPSKLRSATATVAYVTHNPQRVRFRVTATAGALTYTDAQPVRAVSNSVSVGLVLRTGRSQ